MSPTCLLCPPVSFVTPVTFVTYVSFFPPVSSVAHVSFVPSVSFVLAASFVPLLAVSHLSALSPLLAFSSLLNFSLLLALVLSHLSPLYRPDLLKVLETGTRFTGKSPQKYRHIWTERSLVFWKVCLSLSNKQQTQLDKVVVFQTKESTCI